MQTFACTPGNLSIARSSGEPLPLTSFGLTRVRSEAGRMPALPGDSPFSAIGLSDSSSQFLFGTSLAVRRAERRAGVQTLQTARIGDQEVNHESDSSSHRRRRLHR